MHVILNQGRTSLVFFTKKTKGPFRSDDKIVFCPATAEKGNGFCFIERMGKGRLKQ
jgi:hypothetical protein